MSSEKQIWLVREGLAALWDFFMESGLTSQIYISINIQKWHFISLIQSVLYDHLALLSLISKTFDNSLLEIINYLINFKEKIFLM